MPRYVKDGRVIFASKKAYDAIYAEQGYLPMEEEKHTEDKKDEAPAEKIEDEKSNNDVEEEDDYSDDGDIDPNENMPLSARVGLLTYEQLKEKAKELGIPRYANTKREELEVLIVEAMEKSDAK